MRFPGIVGLLVAVAVSAMLAPSARAEDKGVLGAGIIVGEPTGLTIKYYLGDDTAVDAALGFAFIGNGVQAHADYLWHPWILETKESFVLPAYIGVGLRVLDHNGGTGDDHYRIGPRAVAGILFDFTEVPLDVFVEIAGVADYRTSGDRFGLDFNVGAGARCYF